MNVKPHIMVTYGPIFGGCKTELGGCFTWRQINGIRSITWDLNYVLTRGLPHRVTTIIGRFHFSLLRIICTHTDAKKVVHTQLAKLLKARYRYTSVKTDERSDSVLNRRTRMAKNKHWGLDCLRVCHSCLAMYSVK